MLSSLDRYHSSAQKRERVNGRHSHDSFISYFSQPNTKKRALEFNLSAFTVNAK